MRHSCDVAIVGAGIAGLTAARKLVREGLRLCILEARERVGGRIHTLHDPGWPIPIELGAEFIHGKPPEIWNMLRAANLAAYEITDHHHLPSSQRRGARLKQMPNFWERLEPVLGKLSRRTPDISFAEFLRRTHFGKDATRELKELALMYVEGFNAAPADRISARALYDEEQAADEIDETKNFRLVDGYSGLLQWLVASLDPQLARLELGRIVTSIHWTRGRGAEIESRSADGAGSRLTARSALVTIPLGVLQQPPTAPGAFRFEPELPDKRGAARRIAMGAVLKLLLRFRESFWGPLQNRELAELSFMHWRGGAFPTWWTALPLHVPVLTAWAGGPAAEKLSALPRERLIALAIENLASLLRLPRRRIESLLQAVHMGDWQADPFARGAYSYVPVGGLDARKRLAASVAGTLFFAGEATHYEGQAGTVAGAVSSGHRAAREIVLALR